MKDNYVTQMKGRPLLGMTAVVVTRRKRVNGQWRNVAVTHVRVSASSIMRVMRAVRAGLIS